jgi:hypothetical protein
MGKHFPPFVTENDEEAEKIGQNKTVLLARF